MQSYTMRNAILGVLASILAKVLAADRDPAAIATRDQVPVLWPRTFLG